MGRIVKRSLLLGVFLLLICWNTSLWAQEEEEQVYVQKVIPIEHADVNGLLTVLQVFDVMIKANPELRVIAVKGTAESVAALEAALKRLDVPPPPAKNIELTVFLLNAKKDAGGGSEVPSELGEVIQQLEGVFPYRGFRLWETVVLRTRDFQGGVEKGPKWVRGMISEDAIDVSDLEYELGFHSARAVPDGEGRHVIRLDMLNLEITGPMKVVDTSEGPKTQRTLIASIRTDIDVREGQKVVVGKANIGAEEGALFLVVTARVE